VGWFVEFTLGAGDGDNQCKLSKFRFDFLDHSAPNRESGNARNKRAATLEQGMLQAKNSSYAKVTALVYMVQ
jgi:hypothetical protein